MGFMQELKKLTRPYSEEEDEFEDYEEDEEEEAPAPAPAPSSRRSSAFSDSPRASASARGSGKVLNLSNNTQFQVILVKPDRFDNVSDIADHLREKRAVVLNLESTNKDVARRLVDFLSGCAYALDGKIKKIAISTYIITPFNVDVVGDMMDEIENSISYL
ncbi:MAG: cell division protein SepF [Clostridia bacterium]|nr:cell division protein SepF [Clostridia bacterium]